MAWLDKQEVTVIQSAVPATNEPSGPVTGMVTVVPLVLGGGADLCDSSPSVVLLFMYCLNSILELEPA